MDIPESSQVNDDETDVFFNTVNRVIFQRWEVSLTIIVKDKFVFDIIAFIDSGATENFLQEGLIPIQLCEETNQSLFGANGKRLAIKYELTDVHIRNHDICIKQTFILVKYLKEKALLGIPFLSSIYPMWVDNQVQTPSKTNGFSFGLGTTRERFFFYFFGVKGGGGALSGEKRTTWDVWQRAWLAMVVVEDDIFAE